MAKRSPEEIQAQREAWLARKTAREAGEDVPMKPPVKPGEKPETAASAAESESQEQPAPASPEAPAEETEAPEPVAEAKAEAEEPAAEAEGVLPPEQQEALKPKAPKQKRTPEEIKAQREAFLAAKAAREAGQEPVAAKAEPAPKAAAPAAKKAKPTPKPKPARAKKAPEPAEPIDPTITRRELLNYAWLASIGLFAVQTVGLSLWFAFPNFREGEFGGAFEIGTAANVLPQVNADPIPFTDGKFWLVNLDTEGPDGEPRQGVLAIYKVCTHLGCLYDWVPMTGRFECPCHGSKFALTGDYLAGPARRSLDRFVIQAIAPDGSIRETDAEGNPLALEGDETLVIDTGQRILGDSIA